jgi:hypothetical protein
MALVSSDSEHFHFLAFFSPVRLLDHIMYLTNYLLQRWQGNTTSGYIFSMKKGKKNYPLAMEVWGFHFQKHK